jgi:hypothetical protein
MQGPPKEEHSGSSISRAADFIGGVRSGVNGTPTFFINGVRHDGPYDYASLVSGILMRFAADTRT